MIHPLVFCIVFGRRARHVVVVSNLAGFLPLKTDETRVSCTACQNPVLLGLSAGALLFSHVRRNKSPHSFTRSFFSRPPEDDKLRRVDLPLRLAVRVSANRVGGA